MKNRGGDVEYQEVQVDPGVTDKRLFVAEGELASVLRSMGRDGNTLSGVIRLAWDTGDLRTMTKNSPAKATGAHITIVGHITDDELRRYLTCTEAGNGFANRFLFVCVRRSKVLPFGGALHEDALGDLADDLQAAIQHGRRPVVVRFSEEARPVWEEHYTDLSAGRPGLLGAVTARAEAQVVRLALLYALLDRRDEIDVEHLAAALAVWKYCEASAQCVFGDAMGDPVADEILAALRHAGQFGMSRTEISGLFGRHQPAARLNRSLADLDRLQLVTCGREETGGRPTERWFAASSRDAEAELPGRRASFA